MKARALLFAFDAFSLLSVAAVLSVAFVDKAYAYVDPSVMTYTIQALAGIAVALSTVLGVALRRTRKKLFKALGIDENSRKEVEPRVHRVDTDGNIVLSDEVSSRHRELDGVGPRGSASPAYSANGDAPSWKRRFALSLIVILFCGFTLGIVAPFEIVAGSTGSLVFDLSDIAPILVIAVGLAVITLSLAISFIPGKAFSYVLVFLFCGGLCCYVQAMFLNAGLPSADGSAVDFWGDHKVMMIVSAIVWMTLLTVPVFLTRFNRARAQVFVGCLSLCLIVVQAVGVTSLIVSLDDEGSDELAAVSVTEDGLFEVSDTSNVIVFVLDRYDTSFMDEMLENDSALLDDFEGFTYYSNNLGSMIPTLHAIPYLLTAEVPHEGEDIQGYYEERYARSSFIEDISDAGYSVGLYSDTMGLEYLSTEEVHREIADMTVNLHGLDNFSVDVVGTLKAMAKCSLYRDLPWLLKPRFWFYTDEINQKVANPGDDGDPENTAYIIDDPRYYERLKNYGLEIEEGNFKGAFRMIHLTGAHTPYTMNETAQYMGVDAVTRAQQAEGALYIVETYLDLLKEMGLYENSTIIVTSDHGDWVSSLENPDFAISPILMVKPAGVSDGALQYSSAPVSHCDLHATILCAMGVDGSDYGLSVEDVTDFDRVRDTYMITSDGNYCVDILKYQVSGDVLDFSNWTYTGTSWHVNDPK